MDLASNRIDNDIRVDVVDGLDGTERGYLGLCLETPVTTQKWIAKFSTLPSAFVSCDVGSRESNLYTISIFELAASSPAQILKIRNDNGTEFKNEKLRNPNVQYFHVFGSLCYPTNDRDDHGKIKPKADIGIFLGYSESSRGPGINCSNFEDSSDEINEIPSHQDLDNMFGPLYEEYYAPSTFEVSNSSAKNTLDVENTPSPSLIIVKDKLYGNTIMHSFEIPEFGEAESSLNLIGDPSKPVQTTNRLRNDAELCMYALTKTRDGKCDTVTTPMATSKINADLQRTLTDQTKYCSMIGGLMYLTTSQPDIAFATFVCTRYQARPTKKHLKEVKRIFWFLDDYKSISGGLKFLGDKLVSWSSKKQDCTAMSTAKAEYVSLSTCYTQVIWMRTQLLDYGYRYNKILMYYDTKSAIAILCNPVQHSRTKHINLRYHFIKEHVKKGTTEHYFVMMEYQLADLFTKSLLRERELMLIKVKRGIGSVKMKIVVSYGLLTLTKKTVSKVSDTKDTIRFKLETQEIMYTVDMFCDTLHLPVETPDNRIIAPVTVKNIKSFMQMISYQGVLDKVNAFFMKFPAQPWQTMFKVFNRCLTTRTSGHDQTKINIIWNVLFRGMHIPDAFLTNAICATDDYKEYETVFSTTPIPPPSDERERDEITEATLLSINLHKTALGAEAQENVTKVKEKLVEEEIENMVKEPGSHKENMKVVDDDVTKKKDDEKDEDEVKDDDVYVEKMDAATEAKDTDDHTNHTLVRTHAAGSVETRNDHMLTPIPTPTRSPRKDLSLDKMTANVSPNTTTTSNNKRKKGFTSNKIKILPGSIASMYMRRGQIRTHIKTKFVTREFFMGKIQEFLDHCNNVVPEMMFAKINEMIKEEMPCLVNLAVKKD
nr:copia protein [Tanacetum cinerariifolium]